jgi:Na+-driven multidrug efflux pump
MFYGAKEYGLVKKTSWYAIRISMFISCGIGLVFFIAPGIFLGIFTNSAQIISLGMPYLRLDVITFPLMALTLVPNRIMQGLGKGFPGLFLQLIRIFIVAIPMAYIFVFIFNYDYISVAVAMILGGLASAIAALIWLTLLFRKLSSKQ